MERFIAKRYAGAAEAVKRQIRGVAADPGRPVRLSNDVWLETSLPRVPDLARLLLARSWTLLRAADRAFLTADNPVALVGGGGPLGGVGLLTDAAIILPLSPHQALVLAGEDTGALSVVDANRDQVRGVNRAVAGRSGPSGVGERVSASR